MNPEAWVLLVLFALGLPGFHLACLQLSLPESVAFLAWSGVENGDAFGSSNALGLTYARCCSVYVDG